MAKILGVKQGTPPLSFTIETGEAADRLSLSKNFSYLLVCVANPPEGSEGNQFVDLWTSIATNIGPESVMEIADMIKTAIKNRGTKEFQWLKSRAGELLATSLANRHAMDDKKLN